MAAYTYKYVRYSLPPYLTDDDPNFQGDAGYDGDLWIATSVYIEQLEDELRYQHESGRDIDDKQLLDWLKNRPKNRYSRSGWDVK